MDSRRAKKTPPANPIRVSRLSRAWRRPRRAPDASLASPWCCHFPPWRRPPLLSLRNPRLSNVGLQSLGSFVAAPGTATGAAVAPEATLVNAPLGLTFPNDNYAVQADIVVPVRTSAPQTTLPLLARRVKVA